MHFTCDPLSIYIQISKSTAYCDSAGEPKGLKGSTAEGHLYCEVEGF